MIFNIFAKFATYFFENRKIRKNFRKFITFFNIFFNILVINFYKPNNPRLIILILKKLYLCKKLISKK